MSECFWILAAFFFGMAVQASNSVSVAQSIRRHYPNKYKWPSLFCRPRLTKDEQRPVELTMVPVVTKVVQAESGDITPHRMVRDENGHWKEVEQGSEWPEFRCRKL